MGTLHTLAGLLLSALLFAIFWTGTLTVFAKELDRWMMPNTRIPMKDGHRLSVDRDILPLLTARALPATAWSVVLPSDREPFLSISYEKPGARIAVRERFHPFTLEVLAPSHTRGASGFIYPFHHNLTLRSNNLGAWVVGIAAMGMLCLLISGIIIHRRLFSDFFTLRMQRNFRRANLDLHCVSGIALFPFIFVITFSGLVVSHLIYFPKASGTVYEQMKVRTALESSVKTEQKQDGAVGQVRGNSQRGEGRERRERAPRSHFLEESQGRVSPPPSGTPAGIVPMDPMVAEVEQEFGVGSVHRVRVNNPGDAGGVVALRLRGDESVAEVLENRRFSLATGETLKPFQPSAIGKVFNFISGLHYIRFDHWPLRWLYFAGGLGGCMLIATGLLHWTHARNQKQRDSSVTVAWMNAQTIAAITGIIAATASYLLINRIFDNRELVAGFASRSLEVNAFFGVWIFSLLHASFRAFSNRHNGYLKAWSEQCWAIACIGFAAVLANWLSTGDHLVETTLINPYWPVAATDLVILLSSAVAAFVGKNCSKRLAVGGQE